MKKEKWGIVALVLLGCGVMAVVDGVIQPDYWLKSAVKILLFLLIPLLWSRAQGMKLGSLFQRNKQGIKLALSLCIPLYVLIVGAYLLLRNFYDFSVITPILESSIGVSRENFPVVAVYISFVNSLLEEFFFRGFAFLALRQAAGEAFAMLFSAAAFALYHVAIMTGWFSPVLFVLAMAGLFIGGLLFNALNAKSGCLYPSWFVHMFANFAINSVGMLLFGIIG